MLPVYSKDSILLLLHLLVAARAHPDGTVTVVNNNGVNYKSALVTAAEPSKVSITFTENIVANPNINIADFEVQINGVPAPQVQRLVTVAEIESGIVNLSLAAAQSLLPAQVVTVKYTKTGTGSRNIKGTSGDAADNVWNARTSRQ